MDVNENVSIFNTSECLNASFNCSQNNGTGDATPYNVLEEELFWFIYYWAIDVVNVLTNVFMIILIYKANETLSTPNKLLINQAIADISIGLTYISFSVGHILGLDMDLLLLFHRFLLLVFHPGSVHFLTATVFCLCMAICYPILYRTYNKAWRVNAFLAGMWFVNVAISSLVFITDEAFNPYLVIIRFEAIKPQNLWYEVLKSVFVFLLPMFEVGCCICVMILKRSRASLDVENQSSTTRLVKKAIIVITLFCLYWICLLLTVIGDSLDSYDPESWVTQDHAMQVIYLILYHYIILKLPLFLIAFKSYRDTAKKMLCCSCTGTSTIPSAAASAEPLQPSSEDIRCCHNVTCPKTNEHITPVLKDQQNIVF